MAKANVERYVFVSEIVCGAEKVELTEGDAPVALELTV